MDNRQNGLHIYLKNMGKHDLLSADEEKLLFLNMAELKEVGENYEHIREKLIVSNLRLVVNTAKNFSNYGVELEDLISYGNLGLIKAVDKFDVMLGYRFSTFAIHWIKQGVLKGLSDCGKMIKLPPHAYQKLTSLYAAEKEILGLEEEVDDTKVAQKLGVTTSKVAEVRGYNISCSSLDTPIKDGENDTLLSLQIDETAMSPVEYVERNEKRDMIWNALEILNERQRKIIDLRFGLSNGRGMTLEEIGAELGITRERVRQLEKESLNLLKNSGKLEDFR